MMARSTAEQPSALVEPTSQLAFLLPRDPSRGSQPVRARSRTLPERTPGSALRVAMGVEEHCRVFAGMGCASDPGQRWSSSTRGSASPTNAN